MGTSVHAYYARKAVPDFDVFGGIETTLAAARLVLGGVMERFPGLKFCFAHLGGVLPFLKERLDIGWTTGISFSYGERRFMNRITFRLSHLRDEECPPLVEVLAFSR